MEAAAEEEELVQAMVAVVFPETWAVQVLSQPAVVVSKSARKW